MEISHDEPTTLEGCILAERKFNNEQMCANDDDKRIITILSTSNEQILLKIKYWQRPRAVTG